MKNLSELKSLLGTQKKIVITTHQKPDGDAMGSSLALYHYLTKKGHTVTVITPTDYPVFLQWIAGNDKVIIFPDNRALAEKLINNANLIFCVDFNVLNRINDMKDIVKNAAAKKVLIDHHLEPDDFDDFRLWNSKASSTAELVFDFINLMHDTKLINRAIAECIYTGIMTDTGGFKYDTTSAKVHHITSELIKAGADPGMIQQAVHDSFSENRLRFFGYCISKKMSILKKYHTAYMTVTAEEIRKYGIGTGEMEGLVNYPLTIKDINFAVLITDRTPPNAKENIIKLSLRSQGNFDVNKIARDHFNGGGHKNAAGGQTNSTLKKTLDKFLKVLPKYK